MWEITATFVIVIICLWFTWRYKRFSVLRNLGIPGPEPSLLFGNLLEMSRKSPLVCHKEWLEKYGNVVGYYFGAFPVVMIADPELLKKIQVGDFQNFINRPNFLHTGRKKEQPGNGFTSSLTNLRYKRWKEIRSTLTPSFTTRKMRQMAPIINSAIDSLIENIDEKVQKGEWFDIYKMYQGLTMDVIGRTAFGIQTDCQRNPKDPLLSASRAVFSGNVKSIIPLLASSFPELRHIFLQLSSLSFRFYNKGVNPLQELARLARKVIELRRENASNRRQDLLQLMIDANIVESDVDKATAEDLTAGDDNRSESKKSDDSEMTTEAGSRLSRYMDNNKVVDNAVMIFLAGYETTSTALAFTTHLLVHYPEIQDRVREEVLDLFEREGKLDYTSVQQLQYLDQVFTESLRLYPPIYLFVNREVAEDMSFGTFHLKKGMAVQVPVYNLQRNEKFWPDPEKFDPERFSPENKSRNNPFAFQAFGAGPRNCIGMRFAQMEAKLALARTLQKYRLVKCDQTDKLDVNLNITAVIISPKNGVNLKAIPFLAEAQQTK